MEVLLAPACSIADGYRLRPALGVVRAVEAVHTLAFVNQKGGCGKTTAAVHLAGSLAVVGERVLLVDLDPQAHATLALGCALDGEPSVAELLADGLWVEEVVQTAAGGIDLLPAAESLAAFECRALGRPSTRQALRSVLASVRGRYDFVLIDCPSRTEGVLAENALAACDTAVLVVEAGLFALHGAERSLEALDRLAARVECAPLLRVVATLFESSSAISRELLVAIHARYGEDLFDTVIESSDRLREATAAGLPVQVSDPEGSAARCLEFLAQEVREHARRSLGAGVEFESRSPSRSRAGVVRVSKPMRRPMNPMALLCNLHAAGPATLRRLRSAGLHSIPQLEDVSEEELARIMNGPVGLARRFVREARQLAGRLEVEVGVQAAGEFRAAAGDPAPPIVEPEGISVHPSERPDEPAGVTYGGSCEYRDDLARSLPASEVDEPGELAEESESVGDVEGVGWAEMGEGLQLACPDVFTHPSETELAGERWESSAAGDGSACPPSLARAGESSRPKFELPLERRHPLEGAEELAPVPGRSDSVPVLWPEWPRVFLARAQAPESDEVAVAEALVCGFDPECVVEPGGGPSVVEPAVSPVSEEIARAAGLARAVESAGSVPGEVCDPGAGGGDPLVLVELPAGGVVHPWGVYSGEPARIEAARIDPATVLRPEVLEALTDSICRCLHDEGVGTLGQLALAADLDLARRTAIPLPLLMGLGRRARRLLGWSPAVSHTHRHPTDSEVPDDR